MLLSCMIFRCSTSINIPLFLVALALLWGCQPVPEYSTTASGNQWKLVGFGSQDFSVDTAELIYLDANLLKTNGDTVLSIFNKAFERSADDLTRILKEHFAGDSIVYISVNQDFLRPDNLSDTLIYHLRIARVRYAGDLRDSAFRERLMLDTLIRTDSLRDTYTEMDGIYFKLLQDGDTAQVQEGRDVVIHYQGRDLSGNVFDDSRRMNAPLNFVLGNENQVIRGFEIALLEMRVGEKARLLIPSWLAFGQRGSAAGRVPPFTTVVYDIEVVAIGK